MGKPNKSEKLWKEMAELTYSKCKETCHSLGSCCSSEYCEMAAENMKALGMTVPAMPFIQGNSCVIPPQYRPLCTVHQCKINGLGFDPKDPKWTKKYFDLREKLEEFM